MVIEQPEPSLRPTDEQLAEWVDPYVGGFPTYYQDHHYEYLQGMFEELIERRAAEQSMSQALRDSGVPTEETKHRQPWEHYPEVEKGDRVGYYIDGVLRIGKVVGTHPITIE